MSIDLARYEGADATYNPALILPVCELLSISPLVQELVGSSELRRKRPLAEPQRRVAQGRIPFYAVQIADVDHVGQLVVVSDALTNGERRRAHMIERN